MRLHFAARDDAFAGHPWLARHVMDWQRCALDPASDRYEPGDQVFLDLDGEDATVLTEALASQLNRDHEAQLAALRDDFRGPLRDGKSIAFTVAEPPGATPEQSVAMAGPALSDLCRALGSDEVAILPMTRRPILVQRNKASETAHETLQALGLKTDFDGAMIGAPDDITPFVGPLFRIARCNASAPYIAFGMKGLAVAGAFCKHVNFHFDSYDRGDADRLSHALAGCGFAVPDDGICSERFSETGAIEGRRLDLNPQTIRPPPPPCRKDVFDHAFCAWQICAGDPCCDAATCLSVWHRKEKSMPSPNARSFFHPVGRFMRGAAETIEFARKAHAITQTPDDVFAARGTTRQAALRELIGQ